MRDPSWHPLLAGLLNQARDRPLPEVGAWVGRIQLNAKGLDVDLGPRSLMTLIDDLRDHKERISMISAAAIALLIDDVASNGPVRIGDHYVTVEDHLTITPVDEAPPWVATLEDGQRVGWPVGEWRKDASEEE